MRRPRSPRRPTSCVATATTLLALLVAGAATAGDAPAPATRLARGKLLVASDALPDPNFHHGVILLLEYDANGALGVIVNQPTEVTLDSVLPEISELKGRNEKVFLGGPVARDRMILLVRTTKPPQPSSQVLDGLFITASFDALRELTRGPRDAYRAFVGYAGWGPGQLDVEVGRGDWDVIPGDAAKVIAREPAKLWEQLHQRAQGDWVRAAPPAGAGAIADVRDALSVQPRAAVAASAAQRSIGGVALPPPARNACRASTLAFTS
jgi:putative transcriptional regulator